MAAKLEKFREILDKSQRESTVQVLFKCARLVNERALAGLPVHPEHGRLRQSHTALFPFVTLEGIRITELAQKVGISKQAVGQLVDELVLFGVFERINDSTDSRAKLVRWTAKGQQGLLSGMKHLGELEAQLATAIGPSAWQHLREGLILLHDYLDSPEKTIKRKTANHSKNTRKSR